jgi:hypothetical protein
MDDNKSKQNIYGTIGFRRYVIAVMFQYHQQKGVEK